MEQERNKEREREWNRRYSKYPRRPSASLTSVPDVPRLRRSSQPSPTDSAFSTVKPNRFNLYRHASHNSVSSTGSFDSPIDPVSGRDTTRDRKTDIEQDVETEPENEPGPSEPSWSKQALESRRSVSPQPSTSSSRPNGRLSSFLARSRQLSRPNRDDEEKEPTTWDARDTSSTREKPIARPKTPQLPRSENTPPDGPSFSPSRRQTDGKDESRPSSAQRSRFGWQFLQNRASLSPLEFDDSRSVTSSPPPSKVSGSIRSNIPVRSPRKVGKTSSSESMGERAPVDREPRKSFAISEQLFEERSRSLELDEAHQNIASQSVPMFGML